MGGVIWGEEGVGVEIQWGWPWLAKCWSWVMEIGVFNIIFSASVSVWGSNTIFLFLAQSPSPLGSFPDPSFPSTQRPCGALGFLHSSGPVGSWWADWVRELCKGLSCMYNGQECSRPWSVSATGPLGELANSGLLALTSPAPPFLVQELWGEAWESASPISSWWYCCWSWDLTWRMAGLGNRITDSSNLSPQNPSVLEHKVKIILDSDSSTFVSPGRQWETRSQAPFLSEICAYIHISTHMIWGGRGLRTLPEPIHRLPDTS